MIYDNNTVINLTKEETLSIINELDVYTYFLGFRPVLNQIYTSPLRQDKSPSFNLFLAKNGHILYKDFGTGDAGDCIKFVKKLKNTTTQKAIKEILKLFIHKSITPEIQKKKLRKIPSTSTKIDIKIMGFTNEALKYWEIYGITLETLKKFEVFQVSRVWINDELKLIHKKDNFIFAYKLYDRLKLYRPLDKAYRFITNCNMYYLQGWKQLNKNKKTLIITKSLKDVMLLDQLGYTAIAPNGEGYSIPDNIINEIKKNFKDIVIFYDRDYSGIINTRKLFKTYKFNFIFIPKKYKIKDISDFYKEKGLSKTVELLSNLITKK